MLNNIDINKMNQLMNENTEAKQIISQLLENHHTIVSTIAHEIRNPLTLIYSSLQVMELKHPEVCQFPHWRQTLNDVDFLSRLLDELSSFNNGSTLHYSMFSMEQFLKNIAVSFAISLDEKNMDIEFTSSVPDNLGKITGDKIKLEQVFLNLLKNAKDAVGTHGSIRLTASRKDDAITVAIEDNGCGISPEQLQSIFEPFQTYKPDGTGLGLSISKRILEAHGASISVSSKAEQGSVFTITLPV